MKMSNIKSSKTKEKRKIEKIDIIIFFVVVAFWSIVLLAFFPGMLSSDSVDQINQAKNNVYTTGHPIIHTFIEGNLAKLGLWVPSAFQILVFAFVWTYTCKTIRRYNNSKKNKIFQLIFTIIICFIPLNFMYAITLWKDILYTDCILLLLTLTYIGIKEKYNYSDKELILIGLSTAGIMKLRYNGIPIGIIMFLILLILNIKNNKNLKQALKCIISFIIIYILLCLPQWFVNVKETEEQKSRVLTSTQIYCMGAILNADVNLEEDEIETLNNIMPIEIWKENYNCYNAFSILYSKELKLIEDNEEMYKFNKIFLKYAMQKPKVVLKHFMELNSIWWSIPERGGLYSIVINNDGQSQVENGKYNTKPILKQLNVELVNYINTTLENKRVYEIMYRPAFAILVSIICILYICWKERKKSYILILLPMILNIGILSFLIISQDLRYYYSCHLTEYILIIITAGILFRQHNDKNKDNQKNKTKKDSKVLIIIPAYNEAKNIEKTVNDVKSNTNYDYIVVNDCSKDNTKEVCEKNNFNVISLPVNYGLTSAIQIGMKYAYTNNYDIAIQFDGDGQHQAKYLAKLVEEIEKNNTNVAIGSRFATKKKPFSMRMLGSRVISLAIRLTTSKKIKDPTSGMRAYDRKAILEFNENASLTPEPDTIVYMLKKDMKVTEVQVEMKEREFGESYLNPIKSIIYMTSMIFSILLIRNITRKD